MTDAVTIRPMVSEDIAAAASLHRQILDMEFLSRFGPSFMRTYYCAWLGAPDAIALVALGPREAVVGVLLGATNPANHVRAMVRRDGVRIGVALATYALVHPRLARDLVVTRGWRYVRGVTRMVMARLRPRTTALSDVGPAVGEITHVLVDPEMQGRGVGRALLEAAIGAARTARVAQLVLVTPPDLAARHFYERLGWRSEGTMQSRSSEEFLRFRYLVGDADPPDSTASPE